MWMDEMIWVSKTDLISTTVDHLESTSALGASVELILGSKTCLLNTKKWLWNGHLTAMGIKVQWFWQILTFLDQTTHPWYP